MVVAIATEARGDSDAEHFMSPRGELLWKSEFLRSLEARNRKAVGKTAGVG